MGDDKITLSKEHVGREILWWPSSGDPVCHRLPSATVTHTPSPPQDPQGLWLSLSFPLIRKSEFLLHFFLCVQLKQFWVPGCPASMPRNVEGKKPRTLTISLDLLGVLISLPNLPAIISFQSSLVALCVLSRVYRWNQWKRDRGVCLLHLDWNQIQKPFLNFRFACHLRMRNNFIFKLSKTCHLYIEVFVL